jgi:hypothetical protein
MVTVVLLCGAAVGLGAWLVVLGLRPVRPPLAEALAALDPSATLPAMATATATPASTPTVAGPRPAERLRLSSSVSL